MGTIQRNCLEALLVHLGKLAKINYARVLLGHQRSLGEPLDFPVTLAPSKD